MKKIASTCLLLLGLIACPMMAHAAPPSDASLERLLAVTQTEKLMKDMIVQIEPMLKNMMAQMLEEANLSEDKKSQIDAVTNDFLKQYSEIVQKEFSWDALKPDLFKVYREVLTQEEVDGLIAFYESPVGQSTTSKMPALMAKSVDVTQQRIPSLIQQMQAAMRESLRKNLGKNE
ncbi:MAG: DUF2059 domain-containing protein [Burkholderiaceae bacterium]|jgi:hypothetical protein|nr:DUF2059 domain-containing protein [Burkholderiaceae bacterium]